MVSRPITVPGVTSKPTSAYTPTVMVRSWIRAISAATAMRHSKAMAR